MRENLHFVAIGHVDHGKSTLIGRLLYDTNSLPPDKIEEIRQMSLEQGGQPEFAYVMDHLEEERDQRITIDTAQIFFSTKLRDYVIIDAPGHKQFLKNMITGATQAEAALLLIDAQEGLREQTHRHAYLISLLGLKQIVVIINKMDLVDYDQKRFDALKDEITARLKEFNLEPMLIIPISARMGDNVASLGENLKWFNGPTLLQSLDQLQCVQSSDAGPLRFPVQDVYDVDGEKVLVGRVASGTIKPQDTVVFQPANKSAQVTKVKILDHDLDAASMGMSIGITIDSTDDALYQRGQIVCTDDNQPQVAKEIDASIFWMSPKPLKVGDTLDIKCATQQVSCVVDKINNRMNSSTLEIIESGSEHLLDTEVAQLTLKAQLPICSDAYEQVVETGQFVLMKDSDTVAGGLFHALT